ncbi:hypothetical protein Tco_0720204 [Tanacetum coccineum]
MSHSPCVLTLEVFNCEVSRLSKIDDDLFTYEVEIANIPCDLRVDDDSEHEADGTDTRVWKKIRSRHTLPCKAFNYKTGCSEWPTCSWMNEDTVMEENCLGTFIIENQSIIKDLSGFIKDDDDESCYENENRWDILQTYVILRRQNLYDDEREELCEGQEPLNYYDGEDGETTPRFEIAQEMWEAIELLQQAESLIFKRCCYRSLATTRHKGKEIAKPITPPSESAFEEDSDPEQAQKDKEMQKKLALIAKYFKKLYKPTNNNLITSSNTKNKIVDTTPRYKNENQNRQFRNQRIVNVVGARETVGNQVVQQCFNCKEFGHFTKESEQSDWLAYTDEEIDEQELEAHYSYMAKIQEVPTADSGTDSEPLEQVQYDARYNVFSNEIQYSEQPESISNTCVVETGDSNVIPDSSDICDNDIENDQNAIECDDECVALANLIANLKLDVDENKKIQKKLKKANTALARELTECKSILTETSRTLGESNSIRDSCLVALQNK